MPRSCRSTDYWNLARRSCELKIHPGSDLGTIPLLFVGVNQVNDYLYVLNVLCLCPWVRELIKLISIHGEDSPHHSYDTLKPNPIHLQCSPLRTNVLISVPSKNKNYRAENDAFAHWCETLYPHYLTSQWESNRIIRVWFGWKEHPFQWHRIILNYKIMT